LGPPPSRRRPSFSHAEAHRARRSLSPRPETDYHSLVIRVCRSGTTHCPPAVASACHRRRVQPGRDERPSTASHVGTAACPFTRRGRAEVARSCRAQVCAFPRAAPQWALAAILWRSSIPRPPARSHPLERAMGRDRAAADGRSRGHGSPGGRRSSAHGGLILRAAGPPLTGTILVPSASGRARHSLWFRPAPTLPPIRRV
jgi:hypothetical protein